MFKRTQPLKRSFVSRRLNSSAFVLTWCAARFLSRNRNRTKRPGIRFGRDEGYGFINSLDGREIYFHKDSLHAGEFDRLEIGTGVQWNEEEGEKGPQASFVKIVDKPGSRVSKISLGPKV